MSAEPPASAYDMGHEVETESPATFAILVDNEPGVLHRVAASSPRAATTSRA